MIKILETDDNRFYSVIIGKNGEALYTSPLHSRKDIVMENAWDFVDMVAEHGLEVGDFTRRRKPGPKPKADGVLASI